MCGISGFYSLDNSIDLNEYYFNHLKIAHRGPDDEGFMVKIDNSIKVAHGNDTIAEKKNTPHITSLRKSSLVLGHRRLSILDLSAKGHQPFQYGSISLVYNGEIFNYIELRDELKSVGYKFETDSDTEVFLKGFCHWGESAFNRFNGMWAAAIYNNETGEVLLTRDRFGIKPLYYYLDESSASLYFCSEIKGLVSYLPEVKLNESSAYSYLRYSHLSHNDDTFIQGIFSLTPGCFLRFKNKIYIERFYTASPCEGNLESLLENAIQIRTRTDTEFGVLLSGGVDSSLVTSYIAQHNSKIKSFTADFPDSKFSEKQFVKLNVAEHDLDAHFITPIAEELSEDLKDLLLTHEYPLRSLSAYSQYKIYKYIESNTNVKVVFSGQGADEIFSGYTNDYLIYLASILRSAKIMKYGKELIKISAVNKFPFYYLALGSIKYIIKEHFARYDSYGIFTKKIDITKEPSYPGKTIFKKHQLRSLNFSALREYFRDEDRNSMRFSIEARLPFLDYRVVEAGLALNEEELIKEGVTKAPLRKLSKGRVPNDILERKDKMGFVSPQEIWQKTALRTEFDATFDKIKADGLAGITNGEKIYELYCDYQTGKFNDWAFIWRCFCLYNYLKVWGIK